MSEVRVAVTVAHAPSDELGALFMLDVAGADVRAAGGTWHQPTLLVSADSGATFARWTPPPAPGLRDVLAHDGRVWVVGEGGVCAWTTDAGAKWTEVKLDTDSCLYRVEPGLDGRLWVTGDDGVIWRITPKAKRHRIERVQTKAKGSVFQMFFDPHDGTPWLVDRSGTIQRGAGEGFRVVAAKAMRVKRPLCWLVRTRKRSLVVVGDGGMILRSTNDGASWRKIPTHTRADLEHAIETMYGILVVGADGTLLASCNDGRTFLHVDTGHAAHLWSIAPVGSDVVIGGDNGAVYRIPAHELASVLAAEHERDPVLAGLAARVRDGTPGAEMVLEDALRERDLW